jgi:hypothetical protein
MHREAVMSALAIPPKITPETMETVLVKGDLSTMKTEERLSYYQAVCESVGLNPLTQPFAYIQLNGKLTLYAKRDCTDQLRKIHKISITIAAREVVEGCYVVTARAKDPEGREDESIGAVPIESLKGENRSNALMKAETKAKRRVTLGICGLAFLDESEISSVPGAVPVAEEPESQAAADAVAQAKLAAVRKPQPVAEIIERIPEPEEEAPAPDEPSFEPPVDDIEQELHESIAMVSRLNMLKAKPKRNPNRFEMLRAFSELKARYKAIGFERTYYAVLALYGCHHSNEFPDTEEGMEAARCCYKEMSIDVSNREVRAAVSRR